MPNKPIGNCGLLLWWENSNELVLQYLPGGPESSYVRARVSGNAETTSEAELTKVYELLDNSFRTLRNWEDQRPKAKNFTLADEYYDALDVFDEAVRKQNRERKEAMKELGFIYVADEGRWEQYRKVTI